MTDDSVCAGARAMSWNAVRTEAVEPTPWRNGGGLTRELLVWPPRTGMDERSDSAEAWALRLSVADICTDGPFSAFPRVDRWFVLLQGAGVRLTLPEGPRVVTTSDPPPSFRGESATQCELLDGPVRDLNLMLRRGSGRGAMQVAQPGEVFALRSTFRALFAVDAMMLLRDGVNAQALPQLSLAWADGGGHGAWEIAATAPVRAFWIHFDPT